MWVPPVIQKFVKTLMNDESFGTSYQQQPPATASFESKLKRSNIATTNHYRETYSVSCTHCSTSSTTSTLSSSLSLLSLTSLPVAVFVEIFFECIVFCQISVLMNDIRLKSFYSKSSNSNSSKSTTLSTSVGSSAAVLSITKFTPSNNNNHHRTYNNSSKSNKVFLYYTPRDPRLRIFLKTKQFSNRPQCKVFDNSLISPKPIGNNDNTSTPSDKKHNNNHNNSLSKLSSDLCNYGELIGGGDNNSSSSGELSLNYYKSSSSAITFDNSKLYQQQQQQERQQQINLISVKLLIDTAKNCDNLLSKVLTTSDNKFVFVTADYAAAAAAAATSAAIFATLFTTIVVVERRHLVELLKTYIAGVFLSCYYANANQENNSIQIIELRANI